MLLLGGNKEKEDDAAGSCVVATEGKLSQTCHSIHDNVQCIWCNTKIHTSFSSAWIDIYKMWGKFSKIPPSCECAKMAETPLANASKGHQRSSHQGVPSRRRNLGPQNTPRQAHIRLPARSVVKFPASTIFSK